MGISRIVLVTDVIIIKFFGFACKQWVSVFVRGSRLVNNR